MSKIVRTCKICGSEFYRKPSEIARGCGNYCSYECSNIGRTTGVTTVDKKCEFCGKEFQVKPADIKRGRGHFCSPECAWNARIRATTEQQCVQCGKTFHPEKRETNRGGGKYCSRECYYKSKEGEGNPMWNNNASDRTTENYKMKNYAHGVVRHAKETGVIEPKPCEVCGEIEVDAHHDDYEKPLEIRWLCRTCHLKLHFRLAHKIKSSKFF